MLRLEQIKQAVTYSNQYFIFNFLKVYFGPIWFAKVENVFFKFDKNILVSGWRTIFFPVGANMVRHPLQDIFL